MTTEIINQMFYLDADHNLVCIDIMLINQDTWTSEVKDDWTSISKNKALKLLSPSTEELAKRLKTEAEDQVATARLQCDHDILPLQDVADLGDATIAELETLKRLKRFRLALSRWTHPDEIPILVK